VHRISQKVIDRFEENYVEGIDPKIMWKVDSKKK